MKIAIVDDSEEQLELVRRQFELEGWQVLTVQRQIGATNAVRKFDPDVVILDLEMPIKGTDLIKVMRREVPRAFFILMSSVDAEKLRRSVRDAGADLGFSKSTEFSEVVETVRRVGARRVAGGR